VLLHKLYIYILYILCLGSLYSPSLWTVYLGKLLLGPGGPGGPPEEAVRVQRIHLHQYYDAESHDYDLALLKLERPAAAPPTGHARPACLPPPTHRLEPGLLCWVTGWGALREGGEGGGGGARCDSLDGHAGSESLSGLTSDPLNNT